MGSLRQCLEKAGKLVSRADADALHERARLFVADGHPATLAEKMALQEALDETLGHIDSVYQQAGVPRQPSTPPTDAVQIPSTAALDVRPPAADGEAVGGGNAVVPVAPQEGPGQAQTASEAQVADRTRYDQLNADLVRLTQEGKPIGTPEVDAIHQQIEEIKGRYDGMPPGEVSGATVSEGDPKFATAAPQSYSRLIRAVESSAQPKASGAQWKAMIKNSKAGINQDEFSLTRVEDLEDGKPYTKQEVLDYLRANEVVVKDVTLGDQQFVFTDGSPTQTALQARIQGDEMLVGADGKLKSGLSIVQQEDGKWNLRDTKSSVGEAPFSQYQLPGANEGTYREVLLTTPPSQTRYADWQTELGSLYPEIQKTGVNVLDAYDEIRGKSPPNLINRMPQELVARWRKVTREEQNQKGWRDGHSQYSNIPNPIVRLRYNERTTADGNRILFLEEVQAPQKGQFEKMPVLFQKNWREIAFKWALQKAANDGLDGVGWTTGEQQAARYDLSKKISEVHYSGTNLTAYDLNGDKVIERTGISPEQLPDFIGKDAAEKLMAQEPKGTLRSISGVDLKVGGEGLQRLYDSDFRNIVNALAKKGSQKVGTARVSTSRDGSERPTYSGPISTTDRLLELARKQDAWFRPQAEAVIRAVDRQGATFKEAVEAHGSEAFAEAVGGKLEIPAMREADIHFLPISDTLRESLAQPQPRFAEAPPSPLIATSVEADHTNELMIAASRLAQAGARVDVYSQAFLRQSIAGELQRRLDALIDRHQGGDDPALQARIEKLQAQLAAVDRIKGVTYSPYHLAVGLSNVEKASMADLTVLLHEGAHGILAQDPAMAARVIRAVNVTFESLNAELSKRQEASGFRESIGGDPEELIVSNLSQKLAAEGIPESSSLALALWQWVKDLYYRTAMAMQEAFGREPDPQMALDWIENQMRRVVGGDYDWRFAHLFDRLRPKPMSVNVWPQTPVSGTPGGLTDFFDSLSQSVRQPFVLPDSSEAVEWNARFAAAERPDQTQTPAFKNWFGESKVVDENGAPLVVYKAMYPYDWREGTGNGQEITSINRSTEFPAFNKGEPGIKIAGFFGSKDTANRFADSGGMAAIYPVYLSFQKPLTIDGAGKFAGDVQFGESGRAFRDAVRSGEYDGVIIENTKDEGTVYVALTPEQIKSAIGNRGTFDPADPDIRFATQDDPGAELDIPYRESMDRIQGAATNELSTLADTMFAEAQKTRATLTFDQWWAEVHGGETPHQILEKVAKSSPGAETAALGGDRMTAAMNARAAVDAKVLVKSWLNNAAKRDAQSEETSAAAEKSLIETARKVNKVEAEMRDATMHEATLSDALRASIKESIQDMKRGLGTAFAAGELTAAVREAEGLAENEGIPTEYQNLFKRVLAGEVPIFNFIEAIAKLDLPLSDLSTPEIRKAISDNAESDETLMELTKPKNKPLLVALSALVRRNYEQVDLLLLRRAEQKQFLAIHGDLKAIREAREEQLQELARTFRDAKKATTFADRLKRQFVERRTKLRQQQKTIRTAETRRESLAAARGALVRKIDEIETSTVPQPSEWSPNEGATYLSMRQDSEGRWLPEDKTLRFTPEGPAVDAGGLLSDMASNRQYLKLNPHKAGTRTYELVKRQVREIETLDVLQTYPESRRLWFEKWFMDPGALLLTGGGAAAARAKQMLNRWQAIVFQKQESDIAIPSMEWGNRLGRMTRLSGLGDNRAFLSQVYEPALAAIEANPGLDEGPALREAVKAARRRLTPDKVQEGFDEGLKDFLRRTKALSDTFAKIAEETGVFIEDDRLDGELRRAIPRGWLAAIRRMDSATVSTILIGMDTAGWKLQFQRTDPETKVKTQTTEGYRAGAVVNPGGTIVRSATFDSLLGNEETPATPEQEAVLRDPGLLSRAISGFLTPSVITRWLQPFVNKPGQPLFKDVNGEFIDQLTVQQAWEDAGGSIIDWIDRLKVDSTAYPTDEDVETSPGDDASAWRRSMLRQIEGLYVMEAKAAADANQVRNLFDPSGKPAHMLMDARQNDLLPPEHVQHMAFDKTSSQNLLATIAFHAAFGRNGEAMNRAIHEIEGGLNARVNAFQSISKKYSGKAQREAAATAMGYNWTELKHASKIASQVQSGKETLTASFGFGNMAGMLADTRGALEVLHFIANQTTNNPKTGLLNMLQPSQRAIQRRSLGPVMVRDTARSYGEIGKQFFGGFLENFGLHLLRASTHAKEIGAMQGQGGGQLPWTEVFGEGSRMGKRGEEMPTAVKMMRSLQALQKKGARIGMGQSKEFFRQGNIPFLSNMMVYMGQVAANANAVSEALSIESLVKAAMKHYEANPGDLGNPTFRLTAKDLGAVDKAWFFDERSFDHFRRTLVEYGIGNLEQMTRDAIERGTRAQPILTADQVAKIAVMTGNELDLQGSLNTNPGVWASNPVLKFATPLIGWPIRQMAQVHDAMRDADGRASVLSALRALGILASWSLPIGLAFTFLTDEYDDKILKKKTNLGNLDPIAGLPILGPAIALTTSHLDPMDQIRSMGVRLSRAGNIYGMGADFASTILSGMDPTSGQRQFSLDSRILAFSQIANVGQAIGNWINSGYATTYQNLERPLMQSMGGNGALQAVDIATNILGIDTQEARITKRINAGQWLRSAGREVGLEIRKSGGSAVSVTPMGAWTREMVLSALGDDVLDFKENYRRAVAAAQEDGKPNPGQAVLEAFRSRSPLEVFQQKPTGEELDQALAAMNEGGRTAVVDALRLFDKYEQMIAPTDLAQGVARQNAARAAAITRARGLRRQMAESALAR